MAPALVPALVRALKLEGRTEYRLALRAYRRLPGPFARYLWARTSLRLGQVRRGIRGLAAIRGEPLLGPALALLADAQQGPTRGLPARARALVRRLRIDRSLPDELRARAAADAVDALWLCGRRAEALDEVRRLGHGLPHPELTFRSVNYAWALGRRVRRSASDDVPSLLLAAEMTPECPHAFLEKVCRLAPRGELTDLARYRLALFAYRSGREPARARRLLRDLLRLHPRSPLRSLARALLRGLARPAGAPRLRLSGFPGALQRRDDCVATALALVESYWFGAAGRSPRIPLFGVTFLNVPATALFRGLATHAVPLRPAPLARCLSLGIPVLAPEDAGGEGHLVVVIGYDARSGIADVQDPAFVAPVEILLADLRRSAGRYGGIGLAAAPPAVDLPHFPKAENALRLPQEVKTLRRAGRIDEAIARARSARPRLPVLEGETLLGVGRAREALRVLQRWTRRGSPGYWEWFLLGDLAWMAGRREVAEHAFRRALRFFPRDPIVLGFLGEVLLEQGRVKEAQRALIAACDLDPASPEAHDRLLRVARAAGNARLEAEEREWRARRE